MTRIAIFASGAGSNAARIISYFENHPDIRIELVFSSSVTAGVVDVASQAGIASVLMLKERFFSTGMYVDILRESKIDFIVLAGFLWKVPSNIIKAYPGRIVNIHPALLPGYGGKGMYGRFVHEAVIAAGEKESGITIHYVDEIYDHGRIIFQAKVPITPADTPDTLAAKIHNLEHENYPRVIKELVQSAKDALKMP
jgi:phosphoribosylglycinamide formyltransferase-1